MTRWLPVFLIVALFAQHAQANEPPPNVILIVADDLGWADLGCYGSRFHKTPHIDKLASDGRRFTRAYAASPVCSPTRVALLTGKHPARLNLTDWLPGRPDRPDQKRLQAKIRQDLPLEEQTLAELLKVRGYSTAHIGKWHLGREGFGPMQQGFDINIGGDSSGTPSSYLAPFQSGNRRMPGLEKAEKGEYLTDRLTTEAEKFIESRRDSPFFLYLPYYAVHLPMVAKPELVAHYAAWDGTPHGRQENPTYAAMLESLDQGVGRIVAKLESLGLTNKTLVIFTSDNGGLATKEGPNTPATNNSPLREGKGWLYEGGLRVPLIVRRPGHVKVGSDDTPVWSADLFATILEAGGANSPDTGIDGVSLANLLKNGEALKPRPLYWHYPHYSNQGGRPGDAILDDGWKLVEYDESGRRELFNLANDPSESRNLAQRDPERTARLAAKLRAWRQSVGASSTVPNPAYRPNPQSETGEVVLHARTAEVHGSTLRFEPLPHKNTLGYWSVVEDWASFEFEMSRPGRFAVEALVGCGKGSGGSVVEFRFEGQTLTLIVPETGGFQAFRKQDLGTISLERKGRQRLEVRPIWKAGPAVMDLREVRLIPVRPN